MRVYICSVKSKILQKEKVNGLHTLKYIYSISESWYIWKEGWENCFKNEKLTIY